MLIRLLVTAIVGRYLTSTIVRLNKESKGEEMNDVNDEVVPN